MLRETQLAFMRKDIPQKRNTLSNWFNYVMFTVHRLRRVTIHDTHNIIGIYKKMTMCKKSLISILSDYVSLTKLVLKTNNHVQRSTASISGNYGDILKWGLKRNNYVKKVMISIWNYFIDKHHNYTTDRWYGLAGKCFPTSNSVISSMTQTIYNTRALQYLT
jgi:hypothetical protein